MESEKVYRVRCPSCGATPGEPCVVVDPVQGVAEAREYPHLLRERLDKAVAVLCSVHYHSDRPHSKRAEDDAACSEARAFYEKTRDAVLAAPCQHGWRPIETAPKDGTQIVVASHGISLAVRWWPNVGWSGSGLRPLSWGPPTHWCPLPKLPIT